ncbi:MAG: immunoglobulin domain-containing protein, partial [Verrucomicrobia bacterium]|nr:immunoglobulin domain-containing protein [Verrucomicrobiota bacterium]
YVADKLSEEYPELAIVNIQPWYGAGYDFVATNAFGAQTSKVATVTVVYFRVSNLNDSGAGSLRQAVTDANANSGADSIYFLDDSLNPISGTINLETALPLINASLDMIGPGAAQLTVRRNGAANYRLLETVYGSSPLLQVSGLTLQNGKESGGALYQRGGSLRLADCVFDGNDGNGSGGAAVYAFDLNQVTMTNCIITNNTGGGGAVFIQGNITNLIVDCRFVNNSTTFGGVGGALAISPMAFGETRTVIDRCTFSGNSAWAAGALTLGYPSAYGYTYFTTIQNSTFSGNTASSSHSGAIANGCPNLLLINCTLSGNSAYSGAGAMHVGDNFSSGRATLQNCTVTGNRCGTGDANGEGGGILVGHSSPRLFLRNTIVAGNTDSGVNFNNPDVYASAGAMVSQGWNLVGMTNGCPDFTNSTDIIGSVAAPVNPLLAPLANYGGPTLTHMPFVGSPVLDKGNVAGLGLTNDQRGLPRLVDEPLIANASGGDGSDIGATEGSVSQPLEITQHPQSLTVQQGQNATFTVVVTGTPLGYQWRKNGGNIPNASVATFTITNAQSADAGTYSVVISNAVSTITSSNATLTVTLPPTITGDLMPVSVISGQPGCLELTATGPGPFTYQFRKSGSVVISTNVPKLLFNPVTTNDSGLYDVIVTGSGGSVTSSVVSVKAWIAPVITQQPASLAVTNGQTATFAVGAGGTSPMDYQWRRNGVPIPGANSSTLTFTNTQPFQAGTYDVVVGNGGGSVVSTPVPLTVQVSAGTGSYAWSTNDIRLQRVFGGTSNDSVNVIIRTSDGGYLLGGGSGSGITGNKTTAGLGGTDGWVVKVDSSGNKVWDVTLGGTSNEVVQSLSEASNGGYFIGLLSSSGISGNKTSTNYGGSDYWVVKLNTNGAIVWDKNYGTISDDSLYAVARTTDGGCVVGGYAYAGATGNRTNAGIQNLDFWMLKLDASGNREWERSYGGTGHDLLYSMQQTPDGGYILGGDSGSGADGNKSTAGFGSDDFWVVKLDSNGDKVWDKSYGGTATDQTPRVATTADGGYIFAGKTQSGATGNKTTPAYGSYDIWIVKVDSSGTKQWEQAIGDSNTEYPYSVEQTSDGGYIISGNLGGSGDTSVIKLDASGTVLWTLAFGGSLTEANGGVVEAVDGDFVLATGSPSAISGNKTLASLGGSDMWLVKFAGAQATGAVPVLTQVPTNLTSAVGANAGFSVTAANGPTSYTWRHNGDIVVGATAATLNFSNLQLTNGGTYSVTASNASGTVTSPDFTLTVIQDTDGDGLPDSWEIANGTNPNVADAGADPDGDKLTNWQEYLTGTAANDFNSKLLMAYENDDCGTILYGFNAVANLTYTLQTTTNLRSGPWVRVLDVFPAVTNRSVIYSDYPVGKPVIFYRVVTPMAP